MDDHIINPIPPSLNNQKFNTKSLTNLIQYPILHSAKKNKNLSTEKFKINLEPKKKFDVLPIISSFGKFETNPLQNITFKRAKKINEIGKISEIKANPYNNFKEKAQGIGPRMICNVLNYFFLKKKTIK